MARKHVLNYAAAHADAAPSLKNWLDVTTRASWRTTADITGSFPSCKILNAERARFELRGGYHRMVCAVHWPSQTVYVKFLGTHKQYDAIDALTVSMF